MRSASWALACSLLLAACGDASVPAATSEPPASPAASPTTVAPTTAPAASTAPSPEATTSRSRPSADPPGFDPADVGGCSDFVEPVIELLQLLLDEIGDRTVSEHQAVEGDVRAAWEAAAADTGHDQVLATMATHGCAEVAIVVEICAREEPFVAHGPAGEGYVANFALGCPPPVDDASLAAAGIGQTIGLAGRLSLPSGVDVGAARVWVADFGAGGVLGVDPQQGRVVVSSARLGAFDVAAAPDGAWFTSIDGNDLAHVGSDGATLGLVEVGSSPAGLAYDAGTVWVANSDDGSLSRVDGASHDVVATIVVGTPGLGDVVVAGGSVWVTAFTDGVVHRVDPAANEVTGEPIAVGAAPVRLAATDGSLWVANAYDDTLSRIDLQSGEVTDTIPVSSGAAALAADGAGTVWVVGAGGAVVRLDPGATSAVEVGRVPGEPIDISAGEAGVWMLWTDAEENGYVSRVDG